MVLKECCVLVYHNTDRKNLSTIMAEGLRPLATNRTKEMQVIDFAFDHIAARLGIPFRRRGIFAWPERKEGMFQASVTLGLRVDPAHALVVHQAWVDLAWGITESVFARVRENKKQALQGMPAEELFDLFKHIILYEGPLGYVLFELAGLYWVTGLPLTQYAQNKGTLNAAVTGAMHKFPGLMPGLDHEVALEAEVILAEHLTVL